MKNSKPTNFEPYPVYKDSGTPWLGKIPRNWELVPNKAIMELRKSSVGENFDKYTLLSLTKQGVIPRDLEEAKGKFPESFESYQIVEPGDLVFCLFDMDETPRTIGIARQRGMVTGAYTRFACSNKTTGEFAYLLYSSLDDQKALQPLYTGLRKVITKGAFLSARIALPPPDEQAAIVRYLDEADQQIQAYISAKKKLIALLAEQRQAVIHQAVTRGLDPNVRLKASRVEWLNDVPEHWEVRRIKSLSVVKRGASPRPIDDPRFFQENGEYAWVRISDVTASNKYLKRTTQTMSPIGQELSVPLQPGALFLSIAGSVGKPIITKIKCCIHDGFVYFPTFKGNVEFLYRILSIGAPFTRLGKLGTQLNLNTDTVGNICVGWPPAEEQQEITLFLSEASTKLDDAVQYVGRQIQLMEEYRTRLIADVVTGKLDVRQAAEELPDLKPTEITD